MFISTENSITLSGVTLEPKPLQQLHRLFGLWAERSNLAQSGPVRIGVASIHVHPRCWKNQSTNCSVPKRRRQRYPVDPGLFIFFCCHEDNATAVNANERLSKQYNQDFSQMIDKYAIAGDPDRCVKDSLNISTPARNHYFERCIAQITWSRKSDGARSSSSTIKVSGSTLFKEPRYGYRKFF